MLLDLLSAHTLPRHARPEPGVEVTLSEDMVSDVSDLLEPEIGVELDALGGDRSSNVVQVHIAEPDGGVDVLCMLND